MKDEQRSSNFGARLDAVIPVAGLPHMGFLKEPIQVPLFGLWGREDVYVPPVPHGKTVAGTDATLSADGWCYPTSVRVSSFGAESDALHAAEKGATGSRTYGRLTTKRLHACLGIIRLRGTLQDLTLPCGRRLLTARKVRAEQRETKMSSFPAVTTHCFCSVEV